MRTTAKYFVVASLAALACGGLAAALDEVEVTLEQVPPAVRQALLREAAGARITEVEQDNEGGHIVYEAEFVRDGREVEIAVTADGALLEIEETVTVESVPAAVRAAVTKRFGADATVAIEKKMIVVYEVEGRIGGDDIELLIFPTGQVHEAHEHDGDDEDDVDD